MCTLVFHLEDLFLLVFLEGLKLIQEMEVNNDKLSTEKYLELNDWLQHNSEYIVHWLSITRKDDDISFCLYYREPKKSESKRITIF